MINRLTETADPIEVQETTFSIDVLGCYICNTWDEATNNGGIECGAVVIGAGMFGAYCAEKILRSTTRRVLVLDAGSVLVSEHVHISNGGFCEPFTYRTCARTSDGPGNSRELGFSLLPIGVRPFCLRAPFTAFMTAIHRLNA
jgi:hypothetical protein